MAKLIIIRGNSGSGKTTIAKKLQKKLGHGTMLISQDVVRREMLYVKGRKNNKAEDLLLNLVLYGKKHCKVVILEGILYSKHYNKLFEKLLEEFKDNILAFYFDLSFEETLKRHKTKVNANEFGEKEMRKWWREKDLIGYIPENILNEKLNEDEIINYIYEKYAEECKYL